MSSSPQLNKVWWLTAIASCLTPPIIILCRHPPFLPDYYLHRAHCLPGGCCNVGYSSKIHLKTLKPRRNGRRFADDVFKCIFLNENVWILIKISLKFVPKGPNNNIPALIQVMAWHRSGDKPLPEPMVVRLPTHIYIFQLLENIVCP